jgi:hypothetical protein
MPLRLSAAVSAALLIASCTTTAWAQRDPVCQQFRRNQDGSWTSTGSVTIENPSGKVGIGPGMTFTRGVGFMGIELAALLDAKCRDDKR